MTLADRSSHEKEGGTSGVEVASNAEEESGEGMQDLEEEKARVDYESSLGSDSNIYLIINVGNNGDNPSSEGDNDESSNEGSDQNEKCTI